MTSAVNYRDHQHNDNKIIFRKWAGVSTTCVHVGYCFPNEKQKKNITN